jgi:polyisoprenoid-binding protein YceI
MNNSKLYAALALAALGAAACGEDQEEATPPVNSQPTQVETPEPEPEPEAEPEATADEPGGDEASPGVDLPAEARGSYQIDPVHSSAVFRAGHFGLGYVYGMFNDVSGTFELAEDLSESTVSLQIAADSLFTGNRDRDQHLKGPDLFNTAQHPNMTFEGSEFRETAEGIEISGQLTIHGQTHPHTLTVTHGGSGTFPMDNSYRTGFHAETTIDRMQFGIDEWEGAVPNEVPLMIAIEGIKQ